MINELKKYAENLSEVYSLEQEMGQYQYLIDIGNKAPSFSKDEQNEINKMFGCQAQVCIISKIDKDGSVILSSTFYGSDKYDQSYFIEMNNSNHIYILGQTKADSILLVYNSNYYIENGGQFIAVFDNDLQNLLRSTMILSLIHI